MTFDPFAVICGNPQSGTLPPAPQLLPGMFAPPFNIVNVEPKSDETAPRTESGVNVLKLWVASQTT